MLRREIGSTKFHFKWTTTLAAERLHDNMFLFPSYTRASTV